MDKYKIPNIITYTSSATIVWNTTDLFKLENRVFTRLHSTFVQNVGLIAHPRCPGTNAPKLVNTSLDYAL
jgi:hypothetical protein